MALDFCASVLECGTPVPLFVWRTRSESGTGVPHSKTLARPRRAQRTLGSIFPAVALFLVSLLVPWPTAAAPQTPADPASLWHTNLMVFHKPDGTVAPVRRKADWQRRRAEILRGAIDVMGPLPGPERWCPFDMRTETKTNCGSYARLLISYASEPGSRTPAYLLIPNSAIDAKKKLPAILALHPTDMQYGHRVLVEQLRDNYRAYGHDLAERGYVVIAPAYPLMANYRPDLKALGYQSGTMKAIHDNIRALDMLETLSPGQANELDRVCRAYPNLTDDAFVREHLDEWLS